MRPGGSLWLGAGGRPSQRKPLVGWGWGWRGAQVLDEQLVAWTLPSVNLGAFPSQQPNLNISYRQRKEVLFLP